MSIISTALGAVTVLGAAKLTDRFLGAQIRTSLEMTLARPWEWLKGENALSPMPNYQELTAQVVGAGIGAVLYKGVSTMCKWKVAPLSHVGAASAVALLSWSAYKGISYYWHNSSVDVINEKAVAEKKLTDTSKQRMTLENRKRSSAQLDDLITTCNGHIANNLREIQKTWAKYVIEGAGFIKAGDFGGDNGHAMKGYWDNFLKDYPHVVSYVDSQSAHYRLPYILGTVDSTHPINGNETIVSLFSEAETKGIGVLSKSQNPEYKKLLDQRTHYLGDLVSLQADKAFWVEQERCTSLLQPPPHWTWFIRI